jgi:septum formation protein
MSLWRAERPLVLASRSAPRRAMLAAAGIPVEISPADINERAIDSGDADEAALLLACEKAKAVSRLMPGRLVAGADQTLALGNKRFDKPPDRAAARAQLEALAGKTHCLHAAVAVVRNEEVLFNGSDQADLTMRLLSADFLNRYMAAAGDAVVTSVGAYQVEGLGIHLFERIDGDHFTILGLPLLKLLEFLRAEGSLLR